MPSAALGYSMAKIARLDDDFSGILELEASPVDGQSLQQKDKKRRRGKAKKDLKSDLHVQPHVTKNL